MSFNYIQEDVRKKTGMRMSDPASQELTAERLYAAMHRDWHRCTNKDSEYPQNLKHITPHTNSHLKATVV
jgi:hypothetical protein